MRKKHFVIQWLVQSHTASKCQSQNWNEFSRFLVQYFISPIILCYFEPTTKFRDKKKKSNEKLLKVSFLTRHVQRRRRNIHWRNKGWGADPGGCRSSWSQRAHVSSMKATGYWSLVTGHWSLVTCDDPNLFTDNSMETPRFYQVVVGLVGEWCHKVGSLKVWGSQWGGLIPSSKTGLGRRGCRRAKTTPKWYLTHKTGVIVPLSPGSYVQEIISTFLRDVH